MPPNTDPEPRYLTVEDIAAACHEANRRVQLGLGEPASQPWGDAPDWQQHASVAGVRSALGGATPEQLHEQWGARLIADGWRHGPVKDADAKTHPQLVPYDQLPPEQRAKDALFQAVTQALAPLCDEEDVTDELARALVCQRTHVVHQPSPEQDPGWLRISCGQPDDHDAVLVAERTFPTDSRQDTEVAAWMNEAMEAHHAEHRAATAAAGNGQVG